jgi:hypothetical protein
MTPEEKRSSAHWNEGGCDKGMEGANWSEIEKVRSASERMMLQVRWQLA